jgi:orotidine-5'-phosphate decarboxylase
MLTLPDISSPTSFYYTKNYYISKKDIVREIMRLTNKQIKIIVDRDFHDVPNPKFKGPF